VARAGPLGARSTQAVLEILTRGRFESFGDWKQLRGLLEERSLELKDPTPGTAKLRGQLRALDKRFVLYCPTHFSAAPLAKRGWKVEQVQVAAATTVVGLVRPPSRPAAGWMILFGGNGMSIKDNQEILEDCARKSGCGLATFSYRGYDDSQGRPSHAAITRDADSLVRFVREKYGVAAKDLTIVGQSMGTHVAAHAAVNLLKAGEPLRSVALVSPPTSIAAIHDTPKAQLAAPWPPEETYNTLALAKGLTCPVTIVEGLGDSLVHPAHARALASAIGQNAKAFFIPGFGHNDIWNTPKTGALVNATAMGTLPA